MGEKGEKKGEEGEKKGESGELGRGREREEGGRG